MFLFVFNGYLGFWVHCGQTAIRKRIKQSLKSPEVQGMPANENE